MTVTSGALHVRDADGRWQAFPAGTAFEVAGSSAFDVRADEPAAYLCEYL